jgi:hypothetical protein
MDRVPIRDIVRPSKVEIVLEMSHLLIIAGVAQADSVWVDLYHWRAFSYFF